MTNEQINDLAEHAAQAALDAHGPDQLPPAQVAYAFVYQVALDTEDGPPPQLTGREFTQFKHDYRRHLRNLGVPLEKTERL